MFSYEYPTENGKYHATFYDGWRRFHYCMAATYDNFYYEYDGSLRCEIKKHDFYLVSYGTPIAKVRYIYDLPTGNIMTQTICINVNSWNCSRSTIQQLSRWLNELNYIRGISIPYYELKNMMMLIERHGYRSAESQFPSDTGFVVFPYDYYELKNMFKNDCPLWNVTKC